MPLGRVPCSRFGHAFRRSRATTRRHGNQQFAGARTACRPSWATALRAPLAAPAPVIAAQNLIFQTLGGCLLAIRARRHGLCFDTYACGEQPYAASIDCSGALVVGTNMRT